MKGFFTFCKWFGFATIGLVVMSIVVALFTDPNEVAERHAQEQKAREVAELIVKANQHIEQAAQQPRESSQQRWLREMRQLGPTCVQMADYIQNLIYQHGELTPIVTHGFDMAAERGCF